MAINWLTKKKSGYENREFKDVGIFLMPKEKAIRLAFRNNCDRKITTEDFAQVGYTDGKIYFRKANENSGMKLTRMSNGNAKYMRVRDEYLFNALSDKIGERELFFDRENKMYFIFIDESEE